MKFSREIFDSSLSESTSEEQLDLAPQEMVNRGEMGSEKRPNELIGQLRMVRNILDDKSSPSEEEKKLLRVLNNIIPKLESDAMDKDLPPDAFARELDEISKRHADLFPAYKATLKEGLNKERERVHSFLKNAEVGKKIDEELKRELQKDVIYLREELTPEQKGKLKRDFPSGNFLLHTAGVEEATLIIESGQILSSLEVAKRRNEPWGSGGGAGISFNMNDVRVLQGDRKHLMGFITDPEIVLGEKTKLVIPEVAAKFEVRLVPQSYKKKQLISMPKKWGAYPEQEMPRVPLEDTLLFCNELDAPALIDILAANGRKPKGVMIYPSSEIRVRSWNDPVGDHEVASQYIKKEFKEAEIQNSIDWEKDLFPNEPRIKDETFVGKRDIKKSFSIVKKDGELYIDRGNGDLRQVDSSEEVMAA